MVVGVDYTLTVNNLRDQSAAGNLIAPGSQAHFTGNAYALAPIGTPALPGSQVAATNGYDISAGGAGIAGAADEADLSYQLQTGDFDYAVRLDSLGLADAWSEAGLMAREVLTAGARSASVLATPTISGTFFVSRSLTNGPAARAGSFPVNYPNTWLRLKRAGSVFTGFAGFDGQNWAQLGSVNLALGRRSILDLCWRATIPTNSPRRPFATLGRLAARARTRRRRSRPWPNAAGARAS